MAKFQTQYNRDIKVIHMEINKDPSMTIPDQTFTLPEIIARFAKGLPVKGNSQVPMYDEGTDILKGVNFNTLDLSEKQDFINDTRNEYKSLQDKIKNHGNKKTKTGGEAPEPEL